MMALLVKEGAKIVARGDNILPPICGRVNLASGNMIRSRRCGRKFQEDSLESMPD
jgi:hypothetical protein